MMSAFRKGNEDACRNSTRRKAEGVNLQLFYGLKRCLPSPSGEKSLTLPAKVTLYSRDMWLAMQMSKANVTFDEGNVTEVRSGLKCGAEDCVALI